MSDNDSDAPEEFSVQQGMQQDEELRKTQREQEARVVREGKERRRKWAQKLTPRPPKDKSTLDETETEMEAQVESQGNNGMLPDEIVQLLAAREKKVFTSDSEDEAEKKPTSKKKRLRKSGLDPVILKEIPPPQCVQNSLEFLKKQKMRVSRSSAVLNNSKQALRRLSTSGLLN